MPGISPWELEAKPLRVRRKLAAYYRWVKESERKASTGEDQVEAAVGKADWDASQVSIL